MYVVVDYADRVCPGFAAAHIKTANYRLEDSVFMGPWKPLMERRGFPEAEGRNALDLLYGKIGSAGEKVDYICLGHMTTLGCLIFTHPDMADRINRVLICPGEQNKDRNFPVSEEYILSDPVAARIVMNADVTKVIMAEKTQTAQDEALKRFMSENGSRNTEPSVFATAVLDMGCTYGSLYIDRLDICKKKPNAVLIGGYYDGKNSGYN